MEEPILVDLLPLALSRPPGFYSSFIVVILTHRLTELILTLQRALSFLYLCGPNPIMAVGAPLP